MLYKPHTVTLLPLKQTRDGSAKSVLAPTFTPGDTVDCQITPEKGQVAYEKLGVSVNNPHLLLGELEDAAKFGVGTRLTWQPLVGGLRVFSVVGSTDLYALGTAADCFAVLLQENEELEE